jgi:alpha-L-rhamnosidase
MVNQLAKNIVWGQRGNFISVPTDCPNRNERLGWMGDAEIFAHTAVYNADVAAFYTKWMRDVREAQSTSGGFSDISPRLEEKNDGSPAWGDAGVIIPYTVWRMYGDLQIIEVSYKAMTKWIDYIQSENPDLIWRKRVYSNYGDWLQIGANTPKDVLSTAYFAYDALLLSKMAKAINKTSDLEKYLSLHAKISDAFMKAFVNETDAKIFGDTQTVYLLALAFEILPKPLRALAANHLADNIKAHNWHLTTGFVGLIRIMQKPLTSMNFY